MQKIRLRYAKRDRARFTSHRDFGRAFERALRRAHIPMAYSSGFNPHPRISYANAAPTGAATEAEYLEIGVWEVCDPGRVLEALNAVLPPGLVVLGAVAADGGSLADGLEASWWEVRWPLDEESEATLRAAVTAFVTAGAVEVERMTKNGIRAFDARGAVEEIDVLPRDERGRGGVTICMRHQTPLVRPDDVLAALEQVTRGGATPFQVPVGPLFVRLAQGRLVGRTVENLF